MKKIMVIDDTPDTLELAKAVLEMDGFKVIEYLESKKALDSLRSGNLPDLILLDLRMPEISGPDFCKIIRKEEKLKNLKIVFFTASSDADENILKKYNVLGYIFKPFNNDQFVKDIRNYLKK